MPSLVISFAQPARIAEVAHQVVLERNEKLRHARVALARATAAQLPVDAPRFVPLGADDEEPLV
jgi:hypothetical protein